ncbi:MAG: hypothetical protein JO102_03530 [Elusimicrobia bacterium]|nr:hypothetical protein [Elusimicrobiota bacterium]
MTDLYGQYVIPESLGYIPLSNPNAATLLRNAKAALVVRDGYASGFLHPYLKPAVLDDLLTGLERMGYTFQDLRSFPNRVHGDAVFITNVDGSAELRGEGRFLHTRILSADGKWSGLSTKSVSPDEPVNVKSEINPGETFVAFRNSQREPTAWEKIWWFAKGDIENVHRRFESLVSPPSAEQIEPVRLLWNSKAKGPEAVDQESFYNVLTHLGLEVEKREVADFAIGDLHAESVLVVPSAAAKTLSDEVATSILQTLDRGLLLITDGGSALSRGVGLTLRNDVPILTLFDHQFPSQIVRWPDRPSVPVIEAPPEDATLYYSDQDRRNALVLSEERGQGRYLFFAPLFDPVSGFGYARFPNIPYVLLNELQIRPWLRRPSSEAYFDPGYRQNVSIERLAQLWKRSGIRVIHAAAWHFYDKYSYDYARLIKVAHENGILVYAWFEWPHVSQRFWNQHPEWRQKNGYLADAKVDWRYLMNFRDPKCFAAVMKDTENLLGKDDWDGVNIAEFHYESIGPDDKSRFTPFDPLSRAAFKKKSGFDPLELLDEHSPHYWKTDPAGLQSFWEFRRGSNAALLQMVLDELKKMNDKVSPRRETILTIIDPLEHPEYTDLLGFDLQKTIDIVNKSDVTLQVEDPGVEWSKAPSRYEMMAARYAKFHLKRPFMVDINVLPVHPDNQVGYPTSQPTGAEIVELWRAAASQGSRVALYSEWSLGETDWDLLPYAMAQDATVQRDGDGWLIRSPRTVEFEVGPTTHRWTLDGRPWPCYRKEVVWIPPGEHRLEISKRRDEWLDTSGIEAHLLDITGELLSAETDKSVIAIEYTSPERCLMRFNKRPYWMTLDGSLANLQTTSIGEEYSVVAPPGEHRLRVNTGPSFYYFVQFFSAVSGSLIVLFGVFSSGLLFVLFIVIRVTRRLRVMRERLTRGSRRAPEAEPVS